MIPQAVTGYKDFYGVPAPSDPFVFLKKYPTDLIILELSRINALIFQESDGKLILLKRIITESFPLLDENRKQLLGAELTREKEEDNMPVLFSSQSISKLISLAFENYLYEDTDKEINKQQFQNDLWDNILVANQIYYGQVGKSDDINTYETIWKLGMLQQYYIRRFDYVGLTSQIKVFLFYKYLKNRLKNGTALINEFVQSMSINGFFDYALIAMKLVSNCLSGYNKDGKAKWAITVDESQLKMIEHFSYRPTHFLNRSNKSSIHKNIMTHPFYFLLNQHPVILDFNFLSYMAEFSLTYNFYSFTSLKNSIEYKNFKTFKSMLGKSYYEEFMMDQLIKSIFSGRRCKVYDDKRGGFPDFSVAFNEKHIFLFEVKSCDISLETLENNDGGEFKSFLRDQFAAKSDNGRNKGVYQILNHIRKLATTNELDSLVYNSSKKINCNLYPIIIYTENALDIPCVNGYLNDIFQGEVAGYKSHFKKVYPITTINMNTLIENFSLLKGNPSLLKEWIKGYWERCNSNRKSFGKSKNPNQFLRAGNPFGNYLHEILKEKDPLVNFKTIVEDLELSKE